LFGVYWLVGWLVLDSPKCVMVAYT